MQNPKAHLRRDFIRLAETRLPHAENVTLTEGKP